MNKTILVGRLTRDPDIRWTQGQDQRCTARFTLAVDRRYHKEGEQSADFISCIAFGKTAEFCEKYLKQGIKIGLTGRIQTGSYTNKDNVKIYTTDVIAEELEFVESKKESSEGSSAPQEAPSSSGFMSIPEGIEDDLPFK